MSTKHQFNIGLRDIRKQFEVAAQTPVRQLLASLHDLERRLPDVGLDSLSSRSACHPKFAVTAITEALRKELRAAGRTVRVGAFSPGFVDTPILVDYLRANPDREQQLRDDKALLPPAAAASLIVSMINQPPEVEVGDILVRARGQAS